MAGPTVLQELRWKKKLRLKNSDQKLYENTVLLNDAMRQYLELLNNKWRFVWLNIMAGIFRGLGMAVGATVVFAVLINILGYIIEMNLPLISDWVANFIKMIEANNHGI